MTTHPAPSPDADVELAKRLRYRASLLRKCVLEPTAEHDEKLMDDSADMIDRLAAELAEVNRRLADAATVTAELSRTAKKVDAQFREYIDFHERMDRIDKDEIELLKRKLEASEDSGFQLAANQCHGSYGTDGGHHRCEYQDQIDTLTRDLAAARQEVERLDGALNVAVEQWRADLLKLQHAASANIEMQSRLSVVEGQLAEARALLQEQIDYRFHAGINARTRDFIARTTPAPAPVAKVPPPYERPSPIDSVYYEPSPPAPQATADERRERTYSVRVFIWQDGDGFCVATPDLPGCASQGRTIDESLANIREAFEGVALSYTDDGIEIPFTPLESRVERPPFHEERHLSITVTAAKEPSRGK